MFDKMKQLQQMKEQMEAAKERLNHVSVRGECKGVIVISNGNKKISEVIIPASVYESAGQDGLADLIVTATNRALENAESVFESEMRGMAGGLMGGLGLF